ncbi:MAG: AAA family ATPase, partial [Oscillospiraceae bacterium]
MLNQLYIENVAVIEKAIIDFKTGFNVFTGETGAGKSILIDALSAVLCFRSSKDIVRTGEKKAFVRAVFENINQSCKDKLKDNDIPFDENSPLILSREITNEGKTLCKINSFACTVSILKE